MRTETSFARTYTNSRPTGSQSEKSRNLPIIFLQCWLVGYKVSENLSERVFLLVHLNMVGRLAQLVEQLTLNWYLKFTFSYKYCSFLKLAITKYLPQEQLTPLLVVKWL